MTKNGKRQINPRSLENLKLGAEVRNQNKVRRNTTLLPETIEWLEERGNASLLIDSLVASARNGSLKFNSDDAHKQNNSDYAHNGISESEVRELRSRLEQAEKLAEDQRLEIEQLLASINAHDRNCAELRRENQRLLELERDTSEQLVQEVSNGLKAATILKGLVTGYSINVENNVGGRVKRQIKQALKLIDDV